MMQSPLPLCASLIKEVHANGGDIRGLVPDCVLEALNTEA